MKHIVLDKTSADLLTKKIRNNVIYIIVSSFVYVLLMTLLFVFDNRSLFTYFSLIMALLTTIYVGFLLYFLRANISKYKKYRTLIYKSILNEKEKYVGKVVEIEPKPYSVEGLLTTKYKIEVAFNKYVFLYIEVSNINSLSYGKEYEFDTFQNFIVEYKEKENEQESN